MSNRTATRNNDIVGKCKECGTEIFLSDEIYGYETLYECSECHHPNSKEDLI